MSMDSIEGFTKVGGKSVVLTIVERFSKCSHFITLGHPYSSPSVVKVFFEGVVQLHGFACRLSVTGTQCSLVLLVGTAQIG
jgi:hypothetical protein